MSSKFWIAFPLGLLLILTGWAYHNRRVVVFVSNDVSVTIPEGKNIGEIDALLTTAGVISPGALLASASFPLEGTLFPDTYRFNRNSSVEEIVKKMQGNFERRATEQKLVITPSSLIISSLLEKEVRTEEDMRLVAGIIDKRRSVGMALQIDASVAYGVCQKLFVQGKYCEVSQVNLVDNLKRDSAYNTYTRTGLPVGPISNPGIKALRAALNPMTSAYWYCLSAPDGTTIFSKTLDEHNRARARYLR